MCTALVAASVAAVGPAAGAKAAPPVAVPTLAPITGGNGLPTIVATSFDVGAVGYRADEYSLAGTALSFTPERKLGPDGKWAVEEAKSAPYKTRIVVYRPIEREGLRRHGLRRMVQRQRRLRHRA